MPCELKVVQHPGSRSNGPCTYLWACASCDEKETCRKNKEGHNRWLVAKRMERIEHKVLIMSDNGGVGKSTITTNLAVSLALKGYEVGICDMDIQGPSIPKLVGAEGQKLKISTSGVISPYEAYSLKIASMSFLLQNSDDPRFWRDASKYEFITQLLGGVEWNDLNFLLVDLPPGTGNESVTTADLIGNVSGCVIVTTPQEGALGDSRKSVSFAKDRVIPVIGLVENMSGLGCPHDGPRIEVFSKGSSEATAADMGVPFLGRIPLDPEVVTQSEAGEPFAMVHSDTPTAEAFYSIADRVDQFCKKSGSLLRIAPKRD